MKTRRGRIFRACAAALGIGGFCVLQAAPASSGAAASRAGAEAGRRTAESVIRDWPELSRAAARALLAKYGEPARFDGDRLVWNNNGPWKRTTVRRAAPRAAAGFGDEDVLEQSISYAVPADKIAALKSFDRRIRFDRKAGELSSTSDSESRNYLLLNIADEIAIGTRSAAQARDFYRRTIALSESGKSSAYMAGFLFPQDVESIENSFEKASPIEAPYRSGMP
ncbi:MAG: hypothetical protein ACHQ49_16365 [Elusimicrobiota bacterium]